VKNYSLRWSGRSAEDLIIDRITKVENPDEIFEWIRQVKQLRPDLSEFAEFMAATGLRLVEAVESYSLIIKLSREGKLDEYYDFDKQVLEHFKFKQIFFRRSKKAFISFVPAELVQRISKKKALTSPVAVQNMVRKEGLRVRFADIREAHATFMTKYLKDSEIDFLHRSYEQRVHEKLLQSFTDQ
jgi:intergrase/recombinase